MIKDFNIFEAPLSGTSLVEAGAGTGKTYNIASLYVRIILEKQLLPANILVLTYTEAATAELKTRLRERIIDSIKVLEGDKSDDDFLIQLSKLFPSEKSNILRNALYKFEDAQISTIHGFCQRLLKEHSLEFGVNPEFEILSNEDELIQDAVDNFWRLFVKNDNSDFNLAVQQHIVQASYNPDKLLKDVKEVLKNSRAKISPNPKSIQNFEDDYSKFKLLFEKTKQSFFNEKQQFITVLESGKLNGNTYNKKKYEYLNETENWLNSKILPLKGVEKLFLFGNEMVTKAKNEIPNFQTHDLIDQCIEYLQKFDTLIPSFIVEASNFVLHNLSIEKQKQDVLSYDDLLIKVSDGLSNGNKKLIQHIRNRLPIALIDEFQDTDPVQYSIFKSLYGESKDTAFFMIGDPKQAIYSFRGADLHTYLKAKKDANNNQLYSLRYNYRSTEGMINAVNELFNNTKNPFIIDGLDFFEAKYPSESKAVNNELLKGDIKLKPLQFIELKTEYSTTAKVTNEVLDSLVSEITNLLNNNFVINSSKVAPKDIAVLVRKHNQAQAIQDVLRDRGIKSVIKSKQSVFKTKEADELYLIISAILNPTFESGIRAALSTELLGKNATDLSNLLDDEQAWNSMYVIFHDLNNRWAKKGISVMIKELLNTFEIETRLSNFFDAERKITNFYHLIELLRKSEIEENLHPHGILKYFKDQRNSDLKNPPDEQVIRLESDAELVQIVTMHASKGLEYPIVFCPFLYEGISNSSSGNSSKLFSFHNDGNLVLDIGSTSPTKDENESKAFFEKMEENVRLTYVALTRAKSACFIHVVSETNFETSTLTSLLIGNEKIEYKQAKASKESIKEQSILTLSDFSTNSKFIEFRQSVIFNDTFKMNADELELNLSTLNFSRDDLFSFPRVVSFSGLSNSTDSEIEVIEKTGFDYDALFNKEINLEDSKPSIFTLPKGAKTGTLIHNIFEEIEFTDTQSFELIVEKKIELQGFDGKWKSTLLTLLNSSINHCLFEGFSLSKLSKEKYLVEMEFYFPVKDINGSELLKIIRDSEIKEESEYLDGFMKGFIDLVFLHDGKYYLLDYKSNHLGNNFEDYNEQALVNEIYHSKYDLQYHIYALALHRFLKNKVKDYSYETHFGGAIYLFLRGVNVGKPNSGVFFNRPDEELIITLDKYVKKGERL